MGMLQYWPGAGEEPAVWIWTLIAGYIALPAFATCFALRVKNLLVAAALTWAALLLCPTCAFMAVGLISRPLGVWATAMLACIAVMLTSCSLAVLVGIRSEHDLSRRNYSF